MSETPMEPEGYPLEPDAGMVPDPETVDETVTGDVDPAGEIGTEGLGEDADGNAVTQAEGRPAPVDAWSEADPDFEDLLSLEAAEAQQDDPEADLPVEAPEESEEDEDTPVTDQGVTRWVQYELWGRNVSLGEGWTRYAVADFAGGIEAEVDDLTAGTNLQLRIRLVDNLGRFSKWSAAIQVSLPSDFTPPPEPTAPMVSDNNGIIVTRWDGQLMGETPADMSHVLHYVQQMHPAGNPDGPAGDPQLISEFRRAGRHTSGNFSDRVQHRAWLSAVDTTGNESPRSEYAYFTPSAPVDAQRIQDELETLDGRVGEGFAESLTEAIAGADQRIDSLAVGELFVENAIKAPSIDVQDLAANVARMNELWTGFAGIAEAQIDDLLANTGKFKEINAPFVQSHTELDRGWKLQPTGEVEIFAPDGSDEPVVKLGAATEEGDLITLRDTDGSPSVTMSGAGALAARGLVSEEDPSFGGKSLAGHHLDTARWNVTDSILDYTPQGVVAYWERVFSGETFNSGVSATGVGVAHMEVVLRPNRLYKIKAHQFEMGNRTNYWMQALITTNSGSSRPPRPSFDTAQLGPRVHGAVQPDSGSNYGSSLSYELIRTYARETRMRVIFLVGNSAGVGNVFGSLSRHRAMFSIEDVGPSTGPKGYTIATNGNFTGETIPELSEDLSQVYGPVNTATYTLNLDTRIATRSYTNGTPRFGRWSNGLWYMTLAEFADWDAQPGTKRAAQFNVSVNEWMHPGTGNIVQTAVPTFAGLPASFNFDTQLINLDDQRNMARYASRTVPVAGSALDAVLPRSQAVLAVGRTGWGSLSGWYPASGFLAVGGTGTNVRLSTELGGGTE